MKHQQPLHHPNPVVCGNNKMAIDYLEQVKKCVAELGGMGLTVINIYFEHIKPKVRIEPNQRTRELEHSGRAISYISGNDGARYKEYQMMVQGIRVIWRTYLH